MHGPAEKTKQGKENTQQKYAFVIARSRTPFYSTLHKRCAFFPPLLMREREGAHLEQKILSFVFRVAAF
jgi:hypothetical protein